MPKILKLILIILSIFMIVGCASVSKKPPAPTASPQPPAAPSAAILTPGDKQITVNWTAVPNATGYEVWYGTTNDNKTAKQFTGNLIGTSCIVTGLNNGTVYYFWVKAKNNTGVSDFSQVASSSTTLATPTAPTLTPGNNQITVNWDEVAGATGYEVWYSLTNYSPSAIKFNGNIADRSCVITGLANGTIYYVWLKAKNDKEVSNFGPVASCATLLATPGTPSLTPGNNQITVNWASVTGAIGYEVWYGATSNIDDAKQFTGSIIGASCIITGLTNGSKYYVWVKAKNNNGNSNFSSAISVVIPLPAPNAPILTPGNEQITVTWTSISGATDYEVWYGTTNDSRSSSRFEGDITSVSCILINLNNGTNYYIWVKAKNNLTVSDFSAASSTITPPAAPEISSLTPGNKTLKVIWTAVTGATGYEVWYSTNNSITDADQFAGSLIGTNCTISGLLNGTTYYVWIKAKNSSGSSNFSSVATNIIPPVAPKMPTLTTGDGQLTVSWSTVTGASGYEVWYATSNSSDDATQYTGSITGANCTITGLTNGITYYVWVKAKNSGGTSDFSPAVSNLTPPNSPKTPILTSGDKQIKVSWTAVSGADSYEVWYSTKNISSEATQYTGSIIGTNCTITGLNNGTRYYIWVKAKNSGGTSDFSPGADKITFPSIPNAPVLTPGDKQLKVSWAAVTGADSYEVWYGTTNYSSNASQISGSLADTNCTITGLSNGTTYYVWLKAKNNGGTSDFSPGTSIITYPAAPNMPNLTSGDKQVKVSWAAVTGADSYEVWYSTNNATTDAIQYTGGILGTNCTITGLLNDTIYYVWVKAKNNSGISSFSSCGNIITLPATPSKPSLTAGDKKLTVTWNPINGAISYEVWYSAVNDIITAHQFMDPLTGTNCIIDNLLSGTTYYVWMKVKNTSGVSDFSNPAYSITMPAIPNAPVLTSGDKQITATWAAVTGATDYEVWYSKTDDVNSAQPFMEISPISNINQGIIQASGLSGTNTSCNLTGLESGTLYYIWIKAKNISGISGFSPSSSMITIPAAPTNAPTLTPGNSQISVSWTEILGATSYEVWYSTSNNVNLSQQFNSSLENTNCVITGLSKGTTYYIWVRAKNSGGTSNFSPVANSATYPATPDPPVIVSGNQQITVSWAAVTGATGYEVWYNTAKDNTTALKFTGSITGTNCTITGLEDGTIYYAWLKAKNESGISNFSLSSSNITFPAAPSAPDLAPGDKEFTVTWSAVTGATSYELWYSNTNDSAKALKYTGTITGTNCTLTGLSSGTTYYVWVKAKNSGGTSGFSASSNALTYPAIPGAPTLASGDKQINVSWTAVTGATSYEVWYGTSSSSSTATQLSGTITGTSATITGLSSGTSYYVWLKSKNGSGTNGFSPSSNAITYPAIPGAPTLASGDRQIIVSWTAVTGAASYEVWYGTSSSSSSATQLTGTITGTSVTITGLSSGTTYYVWLKSKNSGGTSGFSPSSNTITYPAILGAPTLTPGDKQIAVTWAVVTGAASYEVSYSTTNDSNTATLFNNNLTGTSCTITGLLSGTTYYVWVKAQNNGGSSNFSLSASAITLPATPSAPVLTPGDRQLRITWTAVTGASSYEVYYGTSNDSALADQFVSNLTVTNCTITNLNSGTMYYVWIKAKNSSGSSNLSAVSSSITIPAPPSAPTIVSGNNQISVSWITVTGATSYEVWYGTSNDSALASRFTGTITNTSCAVAGLTSGTTYYVWVKAKNNSGPSNLSAVSNNITYPAVPTAPNLVPGDKQITVSWTAVTGAISYEVWYGTSNDSALASQFTGTITNTSCVVAGLTSGTTYYVWVKAKNNGGTSGFSPSTNNITYPAIPASPTLVSGKNQFTVTWTAVTGATNYEVWYGTVNDSASARRFTGTTTGTSCIITGLASGTTHYIWVKAKNSGGASNFSNSANNITPPAVPDPPSLSPADKQLTVTWTAVTGAVGYEVWYGTSNNSSAAQKFTGSITGTSCIITGLTNGTAYYIWVKAKNGGGISDFSNSSNNIIPPAAPNAPTLTPGDRQIAVSWSTVTGATNYEVWYNTVNNSSTAVQFMNGTTTASSTVFSTNNTFTALLNESIQPSIDNSGSVMTQSIGTFTGTTCTITGLAYGTIYYVWIKADNNGGSSNFSPVSNGLTSPDAPGAPVLTLGDRQITVTWPNVIGASSYEVWYSSLNDITTARISSNNGIYNRNLSSNNCTITSLDYGKTNYVWVKAKNNTGISNFSPSSSIMAPPPNVKFIVTVQDSVSLTNVNNATVTINGLTGTSANGVTQFLNVPGMRNYTFTVSAAGYPDLTQTIYIDTGDIATTVKITPYPGYIKGLVNCSTNYTVTLVEQNNTQSFTTPAYFNFNHLAPGSYHLKVESSGYVSAIKEVTLAANATSDLGTININTLLPKGTGYATVSFNGAASFTITKTKTLSIKLTATNSSGATCYPANIFYGSYPNTTQVWRCSIPAHTTQTVTNSIVLAPNTYGITVYTQYVSSFSASYINDNDAPGILLSKTWCYSNYEQAVINCTDTISGVKSVQYAITNSMTKPAIFTTIPNYTALEFANKGAWYLHTQATDNDGNVNYRLEGPFVIY